MEIHNSKNITKLLSIYSILLSGGLLLIWLTNIQLPVAEYVTLLTTMTLITIAAYFLMLLGIRRGKKEQGIYLLAGLGGKFLAYLVLILIFWASGKNLTKEFIIAFFVVYLLLTVFLLGILFKILKTN
jgi:hypothetical protein